MVKRNQYDVTVDATIVDVSQKPDGIYRVKTTGAEFEAYATAGSYYKNDIVLVQIPNGDYKNPKFILGRKADVEENKTFAFKLPFDDFIGLQDLQGDVNSNTSGAYWANWPETSEAQYNLLNALVWHWEGNGDSTIGNTRIGIEANWQTFLGAYFPIRGSYGFRIIVKGTTASTEVSASTEIERSYYFTNVDMYGNPYAYQTPFAQQKVLDVSDFLKINEVNIYFYQDFNFADNLNVPIAYEEKDASRPFVPHNILFSGLKVYLGVAAEDQTNESTFLYSYQSYSYDSKEETIYDEELNMKQTVFSCDEEKILLFTWVHQEADGTFSVVKDIDDLIQQRNKVGKTTHVFWYRYDYEATDAEMIWNVTKHPTHQLLKEDWDDSQINPNYECPMERYAGPHWEFLPNYTDEFGIAFTPRGNKSKEKFKVVVQHDGTHTTSKVVEFSNNRDVEAELLAGAKNDAAILKTYRIAKVNNIYKAVEDGSINAFHVYDENNKILTNDDGDRFDAHYYYMQIHVRDEENNQYRIIETVSGDNTPVSTGTSIAWAFPRSYTMIASTEEVTLDDAKYFDIEQNPNSVEFQNFHNATIKFKIGSVYNNRYLDNTVGAIINQNGKNYHIEKDLMFGRAEGLGHEFLPVIEIVNPVGGTYLHCGDPNEFAIACAVYNKDGSLFEKPELLTFTWRELSGQCNFYHVDTINGQEQRFETYKLGQYEGDNAGYITKYSGYRGNVVSGSIIIPADGFVKPPIFEVTVNGAASYPLTVRKGFMVCNDYEYKQKRDIFVPSRVEFKSDGADPIFYANYFEVAELISDASATYAEYNIEHPEWKINEQDTLSLRKTTTPREFIEYDEEGNIIVSDQGYDKYQLVFNGGDKAKPQWMNSYLDPARYTYIYYNYTSAAGLNIYLAQSIAFDRNYYASSLVNNWDGTSLTWDEENGAILSTMIAAGSKDANNRFTGVMMGDWHAKGDESLDVPGMYGYNNGEQTFGFKTDGTGFIGGSGRGRIEFDGREAVISNADRSCYINLNPVNVSLDYNSLNNQSFSQNFIYCKVPKSKNEFDSLSDSIAGKASWAKKYFEDKDNDYFVVDPNYGVLTTGGIVAKYGALGNWMISDQGMYQKRLSNGEANDKGNYMYLGFDETDASYARTWADKKANLVKAQSTCETLFSDLDKQNQDKVATEALKAEKESTKEADIAAIQSQIDVLNEEIKTATAECNRLNQEIASLDTQIDTLENITIPDLRTQQQTNYAAIQQKMDDIYRYEGLIEEQKQVIKDSSSAYASQLISVQSQISDLKTIRNSNEQYKNLLKQYETEYRNLLELELTYDNLSTSLHLNSLTDKWHAAEAAVAAAEQELVTLKNDKQEKADQILQIEVDIQNIANSNNISGVILSAPAYQLAIDSLDKDIQQYDEIISDTESSESEISNATLQKENAMMQRQAYQSILALAQTRDNLLLELDELNLAIEEKESLLDNTLIPAQAEAETKYQEALQKEIEYRQELAYVNNAEITLRSNIEKLSQLFADLYQKVYQLHIGLGENTGITVEQGIIEDDNIYRTNEPAVYPINENTKERYAWDKLELALNARRYTYLAWRVGNGYNSDSPDCIVGYIDTLLTQREAALSEKVKENLVIAEAQSLINQYQNQIDILNKEISNINYQETGEQPGLKELNTMLDQQIAQLQNQVVILKENRENQKKLLVPQENLITKNTNLIAGLNNNIQAIIDTIQKLEKYLQQIEDTIGDLKAEISKQKDFINNIQDQLVIEIRDADLPISFTKDTLHADSDFIHITTVIAKALEAINKVITTQSIRYAIYVANTEPMLGSKQVMPYFSVDWNGSMFARRGKIANTWDIDDYALTYKKNNDILYLGTESYQSSQMEDEPEESDQYPLGRAVSLDDPRRWAISASNHYENATSPYLINFGVSTAGELFAQFGHIAGWEITSEHIKSPPKANGGSYIVLDSKNNIIQTSDGGFVIDGSTGTLRLNAGYGDSANSNVGLLYLSNFLLMGRTISETLEYSDTKPAASDTPTPNSITEGANGYGWATVNVGGFTVYTASNDWISNLKFAMDSSKSNYLQFIDMEESHELLDGSHPGAILVTGQKQNSNDIATIFYPVQDGSVLGLNGHRWNLVAENIDARRISVGGLNGDALYEQFERVATQVWVSNRLAELWNAIGSLSGRIADAVRKGKSNTITGADWSGSTYLGNGCYNLVMSFTKGINESVFTTQGPCPVAGDSHNHTIKFSESGGGSITLTLGKPGGTGETTASFNMASTSWFQGVLNSLKVEASGSGTSCNITATITYNGKTKTASTSWSCQAKHGATIVNTGEDVRLNGTYTRYIVDGRAFYR